MGNSDGCKMHIIGQNEVLNPDRFELTKFLFLCRADAYANSVVGAKPYVSPEVYQRHYNSKR